MSRVQLPLTIYRIRTHCCRPGIMVSCVPSLIPFLHSSQGNLWKIRNEIMLLFCLKVSGKLLLYLVENLKDRSWPTKPFNSLVSCHLTVSLWSSPATLPLTRGALATLASLLFLQVDSADRLGVLPDPSAFLSSSSLLRCHTPHRASGTTLVKKHRSLPFPLLCMPLHCSFPCCT